MENVDLVSNLNNLGKTIHTYTQIYLVTYLIVYVASFFSYIPDYRYIILLISSVLLFIGNFAFFPIIKEAKELTIKYETPQTHLFYRNLAIGLLISVASVCTRAILTILLEDFMAPVMDDALLFLISFVYDLLPDIISGLVLVIGYGFHFHAWGQFESFMVKTYGSPPRVYADLMLKGVDNIREACGISIYTYFTKFGGWFLLEPIVRIALFILFIVGYTRTSSNLIKFDGSISSSFPPQAATIPNKPSSGSYNSYFYQTGPSSSQAYQQPPSVFSSSKSPNYEDVNDFSDTTKSTQQKFCYACGSPVLPQHKYCTKCGVPIEK